MNTYGSPPIPPPLGPLGPGSIPAPPVPPGPQQPLPGPKPKNPGPTPSQAVEAVARDLARACVEGELRASSDPVTPGTIKTRVDREWPLWETDSRLLLEKLGFLPR